VSRSSWRSTRSWSLRGARRTPTDSASKAVEVELDGSAAVLVDDEQRTTVPSVYAAGDVTTQAAVHLRRRGGGFDVDCTVMALDIVARALVAGDARGLIKLVREVGTGRLVGASVLAAGARM
jgi:pyruvate/2-oxoglutarate dehydrogenase complex dihydrolipoamide dehydrogenase (E3) component